MTNFKGCGKGGFYIFKLLSRNLFGQTKENHAIHSVDQAHIENGVLRTEAQRDTVAPCSANYI
jgi:hypothetical protein